MSGKRFILALDLGTTGNRAIVFDKRQNIVSQAYEEFPQIYPKAGWVEHDAEKIWKSVQSVLSKTFKKIPTSSIAAIGITNQRETVVVWDKKTGKPIHHAIVWQCRRTADICEGLKKKGLEKKIKQKTGLVLDAYFSATKIAWILDHVPGARKKAEKGQLIAGTIDSWIIWKLSSGRAHVTDSSNASRTLLFDIHQKKWDAGLCGIFRVPMKMLPRVMPSSHVSALYASTIPIAGVVGDQQGAAFAQGCFSKGIIKNTYGTGLFAVESTGSRIRFSKNLLTTVAWSLGDLKNTEYAMEGSVFIAGAAIQWLRDGLKLFHHAKETQKIAESLKSNEGVYFVPALVGLGAPYWDPYARGAVLGITRGTTRAHFVRAALEAIAYQTKDILDIMQKDTGQRLKVLRVDGGAAANDFLMQFQADILGIPVERPKVLETTALGAAGLAGIAVGFWKNREEFNRLRQIDKVFRPNPKFGDRTDLYLHWKKAVLRSQQWVESKIV